MRIILAALFTTLSLLPSLARASSDQPQQCFAEVCQLLPGHDLYELRVLPHKVVFLLFPGDVPTLRHNDRVKSSSFRDTTLLEVQAGAGPQVLLIERRLGSPIHLFLKPLASIDEGIAVRVAVYGHAMTDAVEHLIKDTYERQLIAVLDKYNEAKQRQHTIQVTDLQGQIAVLKNANDQLHATLAELRRRDQERARANQYEAADTYLKEAIKRAPPRLRAVYEQHTDAKAAAYLTLLEAKPFGDGLKVYWQIDNTQSLPLKVVEVRQTLPVERAAVLVAAAENSNIAAGKVTTVDPGASARGVVILPKVTNADFGSMEVAFVTDTGTLLTASQITFYPMPDEEIEKKERDKEAEGRVTIQAVGLAGAIWLANPLDKEELGAATLWGGGLRAGYGFNRYLSVESELVIAWSENASFDQGLTRAAKLGRASAGFKLSLGYKIIPTLRAGLGFQGVSHDAQMQVGPAPDVGFEVDGIWYLSGGVDLKITEELKIGAELNGIGEVSRFGGDGTTGSLQAGIHAAWSWQP